MHPIFPLLMQKIRYKLYSIFRFILKSIVSLREEEEEEQPAKGGAVTECVHSLCGSGLYLLVDATVAAVWWEVSDWALLCAVVVSRLIGGALSDSFVVIKSNFTLSTVHTNKIKDYFNSDVVSGSGERWSGDGCVIEALSWPMKESPFFLSPEEFVFSEWEETSAVSRGPLLILIELESLMEKVHCTASACGGFIHNYR